MATEAFAPAKVNLTLHVTGQRADGYHLLDSLVVFADVGDGLSVVEGSGLTLAVGGPMAAGVPTDEGNSILKAARFLGQDNLHFTLDKQLPSAAGIGGGTSDAAAALRAVCALRGLDLPRNVAPLGADVPVCMIARAARMSGIGEVISPVAGLPELPVVLVNPGAGVSTPVVFRGLRSKNNPAMPATLPAFDAPDAFADWLSGQRNDLQAPAIAAEPVIGKVLDALAQTDGALLSRMSGSGATCFALYDSTETARYAAACLRNDHPDWWVAPCVLS